MRRPLISLMAVCGIVWGGTATGQAQEFNPFANSNSPDQRAPFAPNAPEISLTQSIIEPPPSPEPLPNALPGPAEDLEGPHQPAHSEGHAAEHVFHEHEYCEYEEEEERIGNIRVTPLYRTIESAKWKKLFHNMYSINVGTTFWQPEHHHGRFNTQFGVTAEFQYSHLDPKSVNINSVISIPFNTRQNLRINDANMYAGNIGPSFAINRYLSNSTTKVELGFTPLVTIGSFNTKLVPNNPSPGQSQLFLDRGASNDAPIVGGDFRLWTGIKTKSGFRAGVTGFYGVAATSAVYDTSQTFRTYGGGLYVELPTRCVPHEFPAPTGTFQWFEKLFGLE